MRKESLKRNFSNESDDSSDAGDNETAQQPNGSGNGDAFDALLSSNKDKAASTAENADNNGKSNENDESNTDADTAADESTNDASKESNNAETTVNGEGQGNEEDGYEVEEIVDHMYKGKHKKLYLIRWKGYTADDDTWEPEESLDCGELIEKYLETHPDTRPPKKEKKPKKEKPITPVHERDASKRAIKSPMQFRVGVNENTDKKKKKKKDKKEKAKAQKVKTKAAKKEFEVERIVDHRTDNATGVTVYRIRWSGFTAKDDTWEPSDSLNCNNLVKKYWQAQEEIDFEVERICGHKVEGNQSYYFIKWKGYNVDENTWEPEKTLDCADLIEAYKNKLLGVSASSKKRPASSAISYKKSPAKKSKTDNKKQEKRGRPRKNKKQVDSDEDDESDSDEEDEEEDEPRISHKKSSAKKSKTGNKKQEKRGRPKKNKKQADSDEDDENNSEEEENEEEYETIIGDDDPLGGTEKEWEVERIVDERIMKGTKQYLVRWKGCKSNDDTWEPANQMHCPGLIAKFDKKSKKEEKTPRKKDGKRVSIQLPVKRKSTRHA